MYLNLNIYLFVSPLEWFQGKLQDRPDVMEKNTHCSFLMFPVDFFPSNHCIIDVNHRVFTASFGGVAAAKLRLADASTSFSSGYLTAEFSISPGIPEARLRGIGISSNWDDVRNSQENDGQWGKE